MALLKVGVLALFLYLSFAKDCCDLKSGSSKEKTFCTGKASSISSCLAEAKDCEWLCYITPKAITGIVTTDFDSTTAASQEKDKPELVFSDEDVEAITTGRQSGYYSKTGLISWNKEGTVSTFEYSDSFITNLQQQENAVLLMAALIKTALENNIKKITAKPKSTKYKTDLVKTCAQSAIRHHDTIYDSKCIPMANFMNTPILVRRRRLIKMAPSNMSIDDLFNDTEIEESILNEMREYKRRLTSGTEAESGTTRISRTPYSTTGVLTFEYYDNDDNAWTSARGTAAVIESIKEGDDYFDYILTAGHNLFEKNTVNNRQFSRNINFYRGLNIDGTGTGTGSGFWPKSNVAPTHTSGNVERIWVPYYKDKIEHSYDFGVIKYKVTGLGVSTFKTNYDRRRDRMRLITYRFSETNKFRQRFVPNVVPEDDSHAWLYNIKPYYTRVGMSGSPIFYELSNGIPLNLLIAVHVGNNGKIGTNKMSVETQMTSEKIFVINQIIQNKWDIMAEDTSAKVDYDNEYIDYEYQQNEREKQQNIIYNYYHKLDPNAALIFNLEILSFGLIIFIICCICAFGVGLIASFVGYKIYKTSEESKAGTEMDQ